MYSGQTATQGHYRCWTCQQSDEIKILTEDSPEKSVRLQFAERADQVGGETGALAGISVATTAAAGSANNLASTAVTSGGGLLVTFSPAVTSQAGSVVAGGGGWGILTEAPPPNITIPASLNTPLNLLNRTGGCGGNKEGNTET